MKKLVLIISFLPSLLIINDVKAREKPIKKQTQKVVCIGKT